MSLVKAHSCLSNPNCLQLSKQVKRFRQLGLWWDQAVFAPSKCQLDATKQLKEMRRKHMTGRTQDTDVDGKGTYLWGWTPPCAAAAAHWSEPAGSAGRWGWRPRWYRYSSQALVSLVKDEEHREGRPRGKNLTGCVQLKARGLHVHRDHHWQQSFFFSFFLSFKNDS